MAKFKEGFRRVIFMGDRETIIIVEEDGITIRLYDRVPEWHEDCRMEGVRIVRETYIPVERLGKFKSGGAFVRQSNAPQLNLGWVLYAIATQYNMSDDISQELFKTRIDGRTIKDKKKNLFEITQYISNELIVTEE